MSRWVGENSSLLSKSVGNVGIQCNYYPLMGKRRKGMKGTASICRVMPSAAVGVCLSEVFPDLTRYFRLPLSPCDGFGDAPVEFRDPEAASVHCSTTGRLFGAQASFARPEQGFGYCI